MMKNDVKFITKQVLHQLSSHFVDVDKKVIKSSINNALNDMDENFKGVSSERFYNSQGMIFNPYHSVTWMIFLYRLSWHLAHDNENVCKEADMVYYLNKIMHSNDWFYMIDLPIHFFCEHPLGSVLGRAKYSDYLMIYQNVTIGGNRKNGKLYYPTLGENVCIYAGATLLGDTVIGNNVIISADSYLINETIPDNSIVFGKSPNIIIKEKSEAEIKDMTAHIWKWNT